MGADTTPSHPADRGVQISDRSHRRMVSAPAHGGGRKIPRERSLGKTLPGKDPPGGSLPERAGGAINFAGYGKRSTLPIDRVGGPGGRPWAKHTQI